MYSRNMVWQVWILHDTGPQRSHLSNFAGKIFGYNSISEEIFEHILFGNLESEGLYDRYLIDLGNMHNSFRCKLKILDQENICSEIDPTPETSFVNEIKKVWNYIDW